MAQKDKTKDELIEEIKLLQGKKWGRLTVI